jgi:type I restriction enzyme M protein
MVLIDDLKYPIDRIAIEYGVTFGRETKRADICIFDKDRPTVPYILVELKKPKLKDGKDQLKSYCNATGAPMGVWTNGDSISWYQRKDPNYFEDIPRIPSALEKLSDVLSARWTIDDLRTLNKLVKEKKSLKDLILEMEDEVLANAGVDVFEELFKLIFTKLYDEMESWRDRKKHLVFRNYGDTETELKAKIQDLFDKARDKWEGVFTEDAKLQLTPSHLSVCIASLESVMLFNSNLDVVDEAFEYLINKSSKGEKGQYFTPRYVIDMCVKMLNPQEHETLIDTAAGSCGFPVHGIFHVWEAILKSEGLTKSHLFTAEQKPARCIDYVQNKVFAIDFDEKAVRVGRTLNLIAGDGQTNVLHLNTLDYERWDEKTKDENWLDIYGEGWKKLRKLRVDKNSNRDFQFDVLMANPPFAGDIKETRILAKYDVARNVSLETIKTVSEDNKNIEDLANRSLPTYPEFLNFSHETIYKMADGTYRKVKIKNQTNVGRDILFIERNLNFLKAGGRMAVVLPQGRFNNSSDKAIREYIAGHCRILAVVGLHGNVFKPHTGTKTSVLLVQKWDDTLCPKVDDYPIFFATMQEPSKDNSGDKIYVAQADGEPLLDTHEHLIVKHDLFNHDGLTQDGIAEAFIEFAKKENLSFFDLDLSGFKNLTGLYAEPFNEVKYRALLERLEISILMSNKVLNASYSERIDSYFFQKEFLIEPFKNFYYLSEICFIKSGTTPSIRDENLKEGVILLKTDNIRNDTLNFKSENDFFYIDEETNKKMKTTQLDANDILINIVGATTDVIGRCALLSSYFPQANITQAMALLRIKKEFFDKYNSYFIFAFLTSKLGHKQVRRIARPTGQFNMNLQEVGTFKIPIVSIKIQNEVKEILLKSESLKYESQNIYAQAETLLLNALGMAYFSPSTEKVNIKSFNDSFIATGRLDAEYYQPKYDYIEAIFNQFPRIRIADLVDYPVSSGVTPKAGGDDYTDIENGVPFIRAVDLQNGQVRIDNFNYIKPKIHNGLLKRTQLKQNDFLFSIAGTVGRCAMFEHDFEANINQAVAILRFNNERVNHYYLMMLFNSKIGKEFVAKYARQGVQTNLNLAEVGDLSIPIIDSETQNKIATLIQQSFTLKAQSEQLLATAKRAVELAIETNEQTALDYIGKQNKEASL